MIDKEFIPYEQALELKELGFDEPCFGYYDEDIYLFTVREQDDVYDYWTPAPTYSQAFRFFRENHTLYHNIKMVGDWDKPQFSYIVSGRTMNNPAHMWYYEDKNSYEEAKLACLNKLIEIVKSKQNG